MIRYYPPHGVKIFILFHTWLTGEYLGGGLTGILEGHGPGRSAHAGSPAFVGAARVCPPDGGRRHPIPGGMGTDGSSWFMTLVPSSVGKCQHGRGTTRCLYTPSPYRDAKRSKSEEHDDRKDAPRAEPDVQPRSLSHIGDQLAALKDLSDDFCQQQAQVRWILWQTAKRQRQEASTRISVKNWWKYDMKKYDDYYLLENHRMEHHAAEAGVPVDKQISFSYSNYLGRNLSPFSVVDVGDAKIRFQIMEHMKKNHGNKIAEWAPDSIQTTMAGLTSDKKTRSQWKACLRTAHFCLWQAPEHPLEDCDAHGRELRPDLAWTKNWSQHVTTHHICAQWAGWHQQVPSVVRKGSPPWEQCLLQRRRVRQTDVPRLLPGAWIHSFCSKRMEERKRKDHEHGQPFVKSWSTRPKRFLHGTDRAHSKGHQQKRKSAL